MAKAIARRSFLKQLGAVAVATAAGPMVLDLLGRDGKADALADVANTTLPLGTPILVNIALDGGNDYLNTLVPTDDPWYFDSTYGHGSLALDPSTTLALNGLTHYRLHPALPFLANRWNSTGDVAFVLGIGEQNKQDFSHFDSMDFWATADTTLLEPTGWLGRYNDARNPGSVLASVSLGGLRKDASGASAPALVVNDTSSFIYSLPGYDTARFQNSLNTMSTIGGSTYLGEASSLIATTFDVANRVHSATDPSVTGGGPYSDVTNMLLQAALLIRAGIPSQTYTLSLGPFDSHDQQWAMQTARFNELNEGLSKFFAALAGSSRANDVFVMITSEFGRQATSNLSGGTDHGQAGMGIFIGSGVFNGVYGQTPTLDPGGPTRPNRIYDALRPTIDYRAMHYTALSRLSDAGTAQAVLRGAYPDLGVFTAPAPASTTTSSTTSTTVAPTTTTTVPKTTTTTAPPANIPPTASFTTRQSKRTISVDGRASKDPDGKIAKWAWTWGDGATGSGSTASHAYAKSGTYTITLVVTDNKGATGTTKTQVTV
ncbi:MAG: DUF1501 domain-containing protein [Acidimicrobiia bacterium]|nr:DUF1501 domain-containing protein [Acidimicrobiia bacterium]